MKDNISPEEKLLQLIRKQKDSVSAAPEKKIAPKPLGGHPDTSLTSLKKKKIAFPKPAFLRPSATIVLIIIFGLSCFYLVISFAFRTFLLRDIKLPEVSASHQRESPEQLLSAGKTLDEYVRGIQTHQVFGKTKSVETKPALVVGSDFLKNISLVGVITGDRPQAVLEDKKNQKTFYVTSGQYINEFQVQEIKEGKIILNFKGQTFELYL